MFMIFIIILSAVAGWYACGKLREKLLAVAMLDKPNERSMHSMPVPRGGGLAIWAVVFPIWILYDLFTGHAFSHFFVIIGTIALITVSWLDDKTPLPARQRFMMHVLAVALGLVSLPLDHFIFQGVLPLWLDRLVAGLAWVWFINLTNFMDGIDGISGAQTVHTTLGFLMIAAIAGTIPTEHGIIAASIMGATLGFLKWNWHPAKLFMGDVGSIPLGYLLGYLMMLLACYGYLGVALCLPLYYVADASITLIRRMLEKKQFWMAHREHFYQQATLAAGSPAGVVKAIIIANTGLLIISIVAMTVSGWFLLLAPLLVAGLLWYLKRSEIGKNLGK